MPSTCWCDYDLPALFRESRPIARIEHRCSECGRAIQPGERYERVVGVWDRLFSTYRTCVYCLAIRDMMQQRLTCFCYCYTDVREAVTNTLMEEWHRFPGLAFAIGRIEVERVRDS